MWFPTEQTSCCSKSWVLQLTNHLPVVDKGGHVRGGGGQRVPAVRPQVVMSLRNRSSSGSISRAVPAGMILLLSYQRRAGAVVLGPGVVTVPRKHTAQPQLHPHRVLLPVPPLGPEGDGRGGGGEGSNKSETNSCPSNKVAPSCTYPGGGLKTHTLNLRGGCGSRMAKLLHQWSKTRWCLVWNEHRCTWSQSGHVRGNPGSWIFSISMKSAACHVAIAVAPRSAAKS